MAPLVDWQITDSNGLVFPWWTHPFLAELKTWDLSKKRWLEFGAGRSTAWLRSKAKWVDTIETDEVWAKGVTAECVEMNLPNGRVFCTNDKQKFFDLIPKDIRYNVISVDGAWRDECLDWALSHFGKRGGLLIADNWKQDRVWISPEAEQLMAGYIINIFIQPDHHNHDGNPWKTVYWKIPRKT